MGELAADLVVAPGVKLHFQKEVAVCGLDESIFQTGFLTVFAYVGLVLGLISGKEIR